MSETLIPRDLHTPPPGFFSRTCGVFVAPVRTFAAFHIAPPWFDVLLLAVALVGVSTYLFSASDSGAHLLVQRRITLAEAAGRHVPPDLYPSLIAREQHGAILTATMAGSWLALLTFVVAAGGLALVSIMSTSGTLRAPVAPPVRFRDALSIASHAALIPGVASAIRLLLDVWSGSAGPSTSIGVLLPFLPEDTFLAHLGNAIDLFGLWWALTLAVGFAVLGLRRSDGLRLLFVCLYLVIAIAQATVKTLVSAPSF